jgi:hypothetical protein
VGTALGLSSVIVVAATGYPCNPDDPLVQLNPTDKCNPKSPVYRPPRPTDAAPLLAYLGSTTAAVGFVFSAAALGYEHALLHSVMEDPGRRVFAAGTVFGLLGFVATGTSYFFGLTDSLKPHDQGVAIFASSISGTVLCAIGSLLYTIDSAAMNRVWHRISTF